MPEFLRSAFAADLTLTWLDVLVRLIASLGFGALVTVAYRTTHGAFARDRQAFTTTLVLLTILIAMISSVIGDNVARAFSLVGALSIVRFRTVVEDTRDTAFVILAVGIGLAVGSGHFIIPALMLPAAWLAAGLFSPRAATARLVDWEIKVRFGLGTDHAPVTRALEAVASRVETVGAGSVRQGTGFDLHYRAKMPSDVNLADLMQSLADLPGVACVDIQQV